MVERQHILDEIRRTAKENNGVPLGWRRFEQDTGIRYHDWFGRYWARWNDAVKEAGLSPNKFSQSASADDALLAKIAALTRTLQRFPTTGDMAVEKRNDPTFPNVRVLDRRFGTRARLREKTIEYAAARALDDIPALCGPIIHRNGSEAKSDEPKTAIVGFVYLLKSGKHFKIGKTNAMGRREYELAIQLPEKLRTVHIIKTDDPNGIEEYWHKRFASKRGNGEWFALDLADVQAFKRRKFM